MGADGARGKALLSLLQISDSSFPTGAFSHSQGLEAFHAAGELEGAADLARLVALQLSALATSDCVALRVAHADTGSELQDTVEADRMLTATKLSRELREGSAATGRRFLRSVRALGIGGRVEEFDRLVRESAADCNAAVCHGLAGAELEAIVHEALYAYLYTSAASLVAAGQKLVPLGGSDAQRVLYEAKDGMERAVEESARVRVEDMHAFAPTVDARSMQHEHQRVRLYIS